MQRRYKALSILAAAMAVFVALVILDFGHAGNSAAGARRSPEVRPTHASPPSDVPTRTAAPGTRGRVLVVFFSRTGQSSGNRVLQIGNTARVAQFIHERVGGDIHEIVPAVPYPEGYNEVLDQAQTELSEGIYPKIAGTVPNTEPYSTVFLGYPIWWGEQPMIVQTFMRDHNLNGKTVIPFTTHGGSRWGNSLSVLKEYYPAARTPDGFEKRGTDVADDPDGTRREVHRWLEGLGY